MKRILKFVLTTFIVAISFLVGLTAKKNEFILIVLACLDLVSIFILLNLWKVEK